MQQSYSCNGLINRLMWWNSLSLNVLKGRCDDSCQINNNLWWNMQSWRPNAMVWFRDGNKSKLNSAKRDGMVPRWPLNWAKQCQTRWNGSAMAMHTCKTMPNAMEWFRDGHVNQPNCAIRDKITPRWPNNAISVLHQSERHRMAR